MNEILKDLGLFGLAVPGIAWVAKTLISHVLSKDIENHKVTLKSIADQNLLFFETRLALTAKKNEIRFAKLHKKRAIILQDLYFLLNKAYLQQRITLVSFNNWSCFKVDQVRKDFETTLQALGTADIKFQENRLWFSESLCKKMDDFFSALSGAIEGIAFAIDIQNLS